MKYRESQTDKKLRAWFGSDMSHALLRRIQLLHGALRGLNSLDISLEYPIAAIAGKNGAGKSTVLALACCAFHALPGGFRLSRRKNSYYTFSDFFIQHESEVSPQGVEIGYFIAHNKWKPTTNMPAGVGVGFQSRHKAKGGKWNDYATRVKRVVVFLGIERIVPHSERSQSRSYSRVFKDSKPKGWEEKVMQAVGFVLGKKYDDFRFAEHSKYSLPVVRCGEIVYSGFNMGAGENALFEIFSTIYAAGAGALLVMDEIELGLHAQAQRKFIQKLKEVCLEMHVQVICTTHSKEIFDCLPNDARYFVESVSGVTRVTQGISSEFAFSKLSALPGIEVEVYVEDDVARAIVQAVLPAQIRTRILIKKIGSASSLSRQLAALYVRGESVPVRAVFDGDQAALMVDNLAHAKKMTENAQPDFDDWFRGHCVCLPGGTWPEAWLLQKASQVLGPLSQELRTDEGELEEFIEYGLQAGKHNEFFELSKHIGLDQAQCLQVFASVVVQNFSGELSSVLGCITNALD